MGKLRPSGAAWWSDCPGGPSFTADMVDPGNEHAALGTAKHGLAQMCVTVGADAADFIGERIGDFIVDKDFADQVQKAVDKLAEYIGPNTEVFTEQLLPLGFWAVNDGTADVLLFDRELKRVTVVDYKFGRQHVAADCPQLHLYGLGCLDLADFEAKEVTLVLIQPAIDNYDEVTYIVADLLSVGEDLKAAAEATNAENAPRIPGDTQCQWCLGKATCPELADSVTAVVGGLDADPFEVKSPTEEDDCLARDLAAIPLIQKWCNARMKYAKDKILAGADIHGWKVVEGRKGNREWADEAAALRLMNKTFRTRLADCTTQKPLSPTQALKFYESSPKRVQSLNALITQADGKPAVVPDTDKRPPLNVVDFDNLEQNNE